MGASVEPLGGQSSEMACKKRIGSMIGCVLVHSQTYSRDPFFFFLEHLAILMYSRHSWLIKRDSL